MKTIRTLAFLASGLLASATLTFADPPVLRWNGPAIDTNVWDSVSTNWLDAGDSAVVWQPGAEALFDGAGGAVDVAENVAASNLTFATGGYTLEGFGLLTVIGTLSAADATASTLAAELRSPAALAKTGAGTLTLAHPDALLTNAVTVSAGTLALQDTAIPGALSVASGAALAARPTAATGLMGFYYNVTPNGANFASLDVMEAHFASLTADLVALSSLAGANFDFGSTGTLFPLPYAYGSGGNRTNYFEVVWRGTLTVPTSDIYTFRITHDDGILLALDRRTVANRLAASVTEGSAYLAAGAHDMVLGLYQGTGPSGMQIQVKTLYGAFAPLPNAWLAPYTSVGSLSGAGDATLTASASFRAAQTPASTFTGALAGPAGSRFTKAGWSALTLASPAATSNALAGDVAVQGGVLALATAERIGDTSTVTLGANSGLNVAASETLGSLAGAGTVILGNGTTVRVAPFSADADCGLSTNKTYTHLLDFPDNGNPATVNGVEFLSAGMSGSANGYSWSVSGNAPTGAWNDPPNDSTRTGIDRLLWDFQYGGTDYTLTLSGLTPGQSYETRLYFRSFGGVNPNSPRKLTFFFTAGSAFLGSVNYNPDAQYTRSLLSCRYTADTSGTLSVRVLVHNSGHTCHVYGLSNEETAAPEAPPAPAATYPRVVAFTGDADSGLSTAKAYTHLLDFPANGNPATVNGVDFLAAGLSGSALGYAWGITAGTAPTGVWNGDPNDSTRTGVDRLLWDFLYNSADFTLTLTGLTPGRAYETRLYFRYFGSLVSDSPRDIIATFTAGSTLVGSVPHDLDTVFRSRIECRYTADAAGSVSIRVVSVNAGSSCHLYGLSNEEVNEPSVLTLDTPSGSAARHTGAVTGFGTLVKRGQGTQRLGGVNRLPTPLEVQEGTLALEPGASLLAGAVVNAGATLAAPNGDVWLGGLSGAGTFSLAGLPPYPVTNLLTFTYFTNDLTTGLSPAKTYTHLLDLGTRANVAVINGVTFNKVSSQNGSINGYGWSNFPPSAHGGNAPPVDHSVPEGSGAYDLLYDMDYGWSYPSPATMKLTGLIPGKRYEVRLYNRAWGWTGSRTQTVTFDPDGAGPITESATFNPDAMNANFLAYRYTAVSTTLDITILSALNNQTLHLYGLTNEEIEDAAYTPVTVDLAQDSLFSGLVTGAGAWAKSGAGTLTLTATNDATGALAVHAGDLCVAAGGTATLGPVTVADGAALTGDGRVGGDVAVLSNATLRAGTAAACGTLAIGGGLTLAPGARPVWRYASGAADAVTVGGLLTFPSNGVLRVETLTPGLKPPAIATVFASSAVIDGPATLAGWTVEGVENARLIYSGDRTDIRFYTPRGTMILIR
jgi:autotransporter-associated beta strand protein